MVCSRKYSVACLHLVGDSIACQNETSAIINASPSFTLFNIIISGREAMEALQRRALARAISESAHQ